MRVMIFGTFDVLHEGHKFFIREARALGSSLVIVVARDATVLKLKGKLPQENAIIRKSHIENLHIANKVIIGNKQDHLNAVRKYRPDIILLGYDQKHFAETLREDLDNMDMRQTKIIRAGAYHPEKYKSSILKETEKNNDR